MVDGRTLVVGVGSDLRRDDGVGRRVAERVEEMHLPGVEVRVLTQLVPELVELIVAVDRVVFVDAEQGAGDMTVRKVTSGPGPSGSHHGSAEELLRLAELIHGRAPEAYVLGVPASDFDLGIGLTEETHGRVESAAERVAGLVAGQAPRGNQIDR